MRLQLGAAAFIFCLVLGSAHAQELDRTPSSEGRVRIYTDDDHVTVVSPAVATRLPLGETFELALASTVDVVSAASVDVITQASPSEVHEIRVEGDASLVWALSSRMRLRAGGIVSHESDYDSIRPMVGGQIEVADRNATIDIGYTLAIDEVGDARDEKFSKSRRGHIVSAGYTQILDVRTYVDLIVELRHFKGFHSSPYRMVPIVSPLSSAIDSLDERTPSLRKSAAALLGVRRSLTSNWFLHSSIRAYSDEWEVASLTLSAQLLRTFADERFLVGWNLRAYSQGAASFYRAYYEVGAAGEMPEFRTRDRSLGTMRSLHSSLTLDAALAKNPSTESWRLRSMLSVTQFTFPNFPAQAERNALILGLSLLAPL